MLALVLGACVTTTGGDRITFSAEVRSAAPVLQVDGTPAVQWVDDAGWTVTLTEARVWVGPIYLWSAEPRLDPSGLGALPAPQRWLATALHTLIPAAQAADQFRAGFLVGEVAHQVEVDLLGPPVSMPDGDGLAGPSRSAELWLEPVQGAATLSLTGTAAKDGQILAFSADMTVDDSWVLQEDDNPVLLRRLRGLLWEAELAEGGALTLHVDPRRWLEGADYTLLPAADLPGSVVPLTPDDPVGRALYARSRRIGSTGPWAFTWTPPEETP